MKGEDSAKWTQAGDIYLNEFWFLCFLFTHPASDCICPYGTMLPLTRIFGLSEVDREVTGAKFKISYIIRSCLKYFSKRRIINTENVLFLLWQVPLKIPM